MQMMINSKVIHQQALEMFNGNAARNQEWLHGTKLKALFSTMFQKLSSRILLCRPLVTSAVPSPNTCILLLSTIISTVAASVTVTGEAHYHLQTLLPRLQKLLFFWLLGLLLPAAGFFCYNYYLVCQSNFITITH